MASKELNFDYVHLKNFLSYKDTKFSLKDRGLTLLLGHNVKDNKSNGAGKSALISDSIMWGLYGKTVRDISVAKIPNRFSKGTCSVEVKFSVGDDTYLIRRSRNPDGVFFSINDKDVSQGDSRETDKYIETIIGIGYDEFLNSILFGQNIQKYFFLLTDAKQKDMLDTIIDIEEFDRYKEKMKEKLSAVVEVKNEKSAKQHEVSSLILKCGENIAEYLKKEEEYLRLQNQAFDEKIAELESHETGLLEQISLEKEKLYDLDIASFDSLKKKKEDTQGAIAILSARVKENSETVKRRKEFVLVDGSLVLVRPEDTRTKEELNTEYLAIANKLGEIKSRINVEESRLAIVTKNIKSVYSTVGLPCTACKRPIDTACAKDVVAVSEEEQNKLTGIIAELRNEVLDLQQLLPPIKEALADRTLQESFDVILKAEEDFKNNRGMLDVLTASLLPLIKEVREYEDKVNHNNDVKIVIATLSGNRSTVKATLEGVLKDKEKAKTSVNPYTELILKDTNQKILYEEEIVNIDALLSQITNVELACAYWVKAFGDKGGVKSYIYNKVFPYLTDKCNQYLTTLSNGRIQANIGLDDKGRFVVSTSNEDGSDNYKGNSGGEKRRIDLAVMLALHDLVSSRKFKSNILILDEIFDALDINGIDSAMSLLQEIATEYSSIFVISHSDMKEYFDNQVTVTKDGNFSSVS